MVESTLILLFSLLQHSLDPQIVDESFRHVHSFRAKSHLYMSQLYKELGRYVGQDNSDKSVPSTFLVGRACIELKIRIHRCIHSRVVCGDSADESESAILEEIAYSKLSTGVSNAEAYYQLGMIALQRARTSGEIQGLWKEESILPEESACRAHLESSLSFTYEARKLFRCALRQAPPASFNLTKNILRCLALVNGPKDEQAGTGFTSASLINISVGGSSRNIVRDGVRGGRVFELFRAFDDETLDHDARVKAVSLLIMNAATLIPPNWNLSTIATCPTGEMLISSIRVSLNTGEERLVECSTSCIHPASTDTPNEKSQYGIHADVLIPLDRIIDRSQNQLHGITEEVQNEDYDEKSKRRQWWKERRSIDEDLESLLRHAENTYFIHDPIRRKLVPDIFDTGERQNDDDRSECSDLGPGNLESKFEAAERDLPQPLDFNKEAERLNLTKLTVAAIKSKLILLGVSTGNAKKKNKAELIDMLLTAMENVFVEEVSSTDSSERRTSNDSQNNYCRVDGDQAQVEPCTILILDEHLVRFPFESMDMLSNMAITRVPSLPFVLATLLERQNCPQSTTTSPTVDPRNVKYVVDPESNLSESASTLAPALTSLASRNGWKWEGVVGEMPSTEFMSAALAEENGLYLYCGHGGGEKSFSRSQIEELMTSDDGIRGCRTPIVLMGCSSGKLRSVNMPKEYSSEHELIMHYEPEGIALSYLYAGAPCVVANLWDVTDRDIDR